MAEGVNSPTPTTAEVIGGVYNATPPVLQDGQAAAIQLDINGNVKTSGGSGGGGNVNITGVNSTPPALTNPLPVELSDGTQAVGTAGNPLSVNVISGGGSNASVGVTGNTAPTSATEIGLIDTNGKLQGASITTPLPVQLSNGSNAIGTFSSPVFTFDTVNGTVGQEAGSLIVPIGGLKGAAYAPVLIDTNGSLQVVIEQPATSPIPVSIQGASSNDGIFQEMLMELRAMRKTLMLVYEESGEGDLSKDFVDDVITPTNFDY